MAAEGADGDALTGARAAAAVDECGSKGSRSGRWRGWRWRQGGRNSTMGAGARVAAAVDGEGAVGGNGRRERR